MPETTRSRRPAARWSGPRRDAVRSRKRRANEYMRDGLRLLDPDERIPFFCECRRSECDAKVWLTGRGFDRVRATPGGGLSAHGEGLPAPARA